MKSLTKFLNLGCQWTSQGVPVGFFQIALPVVLRMRGVSLETIGLTSFVTIGWSLKFLWAPILDRYYSPHFGRRRGWILPLQLLEVLLLLTLAQFAAVGPILLILLILNFEAATQDVATDGMAVELMAPAERGWGNGIKIGCFFVGMLLGGGLLLILYEKFGWRTPLTCSQALMWLSGYR